MSSRLDGRVAIVTGGGRGIGRAIALELASQGADVAIAVSRDVAAAEAVAEEVRALGRKAIARQADVSSAAAADSLVADTVTELGRVDILVNNAGITRDALLLRMSEEDWDAVLSVNLKGTFLCTRAVLKRMLKQRSGRIINVTSIMGVHGSAGQGNYSAAKAGMIGLTQATAKEVGSRGITCNAVAPGWVQTQMTADLPADYAAKVLTQIPLGRLGVPEDIAPLIAFLSSDSASYITGQVIIVDGGLIA